MESHEGQDAISVGRGALRRGELDGCFGTAMAGDRLLERCLVEASSDKAGDAGWRSTFDAGIWSCSSTGDTVVRNLGGSPGLEDSTVACVGRGGMGRMGDDGRRNVARRNDFLAGAELVTVLREIG